MVPRNHRGFLEKRWDLQFSETRKVADDKLWVDLKEEVNADGDNLDYFFADSGDTVPLSEIELLPDFCRDVSLKDVKLGKGPRQISESSGSMTEAAMIWPGKESSDTIQTL